MTRASDYKWRVMKQLFGRPPARHLAERGRDRARVDDVVDVGHAAVKTRVVNETRGGEPWRKCSTVTCLRETWPLAAAAQRSRGWAAAAPRRRADCRLATAPSFDTACLTSESPQRSLSQKWAFSASTCFIASYISWIRQRRPTSATRHCELHTTRDDLCFSLFLSRVSRTSVSLARRVNYWSPLAAMMRCVSFSRARCVIESWKSKQFAKFTFVKSQISIITNMEM